MRSCLVVMQEFIDPVLIVIDLQRSCSLRSDSLVGDAMMYRIE